MKNFFLLPLFTIFFSCQYQTEIKRKTAVVKDSVVQKEVKVDTIAVKDLDTIEKKKQSEKIKSNEGSVVLLPDNLYAVIILDYYSKYNKDDSVTTWISVPKKVKVFNRKTKKRVRERRFDDYYADLNDDHENYIYYGDFNFDGKMDVAIRGEEIGYRSFSYWNFYLATSKGYKFSKSISRIMDEPIAYLKLDAQNKRILSYREAEFYNCSEYKIKSNKAELVKETSASHDPSPFISHSEKLWKGKKWTQTKDYLTLSNDTEKQEKQTIISFDIKNKRRKIMLFIDDSVSENLCYVEIKNDSIVDFNARDIFIKYNTKENALFFKNENKEFKIFEGIDKIDIEMTEKGIKTKLYGNPKSKKGSLLKLKSKEWQNEYWFRRSVLIQK